MLPNRRPWLAAAYPSVDAGAGGGGGAPAPTPTPPAQVQITQEELTRRMTAEKDQGRRAGSRELLDKAGVQTAEELAALIEAGRKAQEAGQSEAQRLATQAAADAAQAKADKAAAATERHQLRIERALIAAKAVDPAKTVAMLSSVPIDADDATLTTAVVDLAKAIPGLFTPAAETTATPGQAPGTDAPPAVSDPFAPPPLAGAVAAPAPPTGAGATGAPGSSFGAGGNAEADRRFGKPKADG